MLEARLEGKQHIAVTDLADTYEKAVDGVIQKLKSCLETIIGRSRNHKTPVDL